MPGRRPSTHVPRLRDRFRTSSPLGAWHPVPMHLTKYRALSLLLGFALLGACDCSCGSGDHGGDGDDGGSIGDGSSGDGASGDGSTPDAQVTPPPDVHVLITADNAYGFGYGSGLALSNYFMGIEDNGNDIFLCSAECDASTPCAVGACDSFGTCNEDRNGPETYIVPGDSAPQDGYLYVITWSDESVTQGLIGQFRASDGNSPTVYTGSPDWEVCATGVDIDLPDPDPTITTINAQIANCNLATSNPTFSGGWIGTTIGNNPMNNMALTVLTNVANEPVQFANLCRGAAFMTGDTLDAEARWMWFDDDITMAPDAFNSNGNPRGDFLIFRLPISSVIIIE